MCKLPTTLSMLTLMVELALVGCSGPTTPNGLTGTWTGRADNTDGTHYLLSLQLADSHGALAGSVRVDLNDAADNLIAWQACVLSGDYEAAAVNMRWTCASDSVPWTFTGTIAASRSQLVGNLTARTVYNVRVTLQRAS